MSIDLDAVTRLWWPDAKTLACTRLTGGVSADVWRAADVDDAGNPRREAVFRLCAAGQDAAVERQRLQMLRAAGVPAPMPLWHGVLDEGFGDASGRTVLAMDVVDGATRLPDDVDDALAQMAAVLAQVHRVALDRAVDALSPLENPLDEVGAFIDKLTDVDDAIRRDAHDAVAAWRRRPNPDVFVHGDFWPGNILWKDGAIAAVIDVEDAARGDALADLATARVELQCALGSAAKETFTTLFLQHSDLDTHDLPLWELYASSASLAFMGVWGLPPDEEAHRRQHTQLCFAQALASMRAAQP